MSTLKMLFVAFATVLLSGCLATGGGVYRDKHVTLGGVASNAQPMPRPYYGQPAPYGGQPYYGQQYGPPPPVVYQPAPMYQQMPHYAPPPVVVVPMPRPPVAYPHHQHPRVLDCSSRNAHRNEYSRYDRYGQPNPCYWGYNIR